MGQFSKRTFSGLVGVALLATACTGDGDSGAIPDDVGRTLGGDTESAETNTATTTTTAAPEVTTTTVLAPSTLAFSSSDDVGRLFLVGTDITAARSAGGLPEASAVTAGTIVQASSLRESDDAVWVRIESTTPDGPTLGWVPANILEPTLESVFYQNNETAREFRQVSGSIPDDVLSAFASPGQGAAIANLQEDQIAMHGGVSALGPGGDFWLDLIDPASGERLGWVEARYFSRVNSGQIQDNNNESVKRSPEDDVTYGQALNGSVTASGCNAVQVTFTNSSNSAGIGMTFGTSSPIGRERNNGSFDWSGTGAFSEAGQDIIVTIPTDSATTWYFAPLDTDEEASFTSRDADGFAIAAGVVEIAVPGTSCAFVPVEDDLDTFYDVPETEAEPEDESEGEADGDEESEEEPPAESTDDELIDPDVDPVETEATEPTE